MNNIYLFSRHLLLNIAIPLKKIFLKLFFSLKIASKWPSLDDESASPTVPTHQRGMVDTKKVTEENLVETAQEEDDQIEQSIDDVAINVEADDKEPLLK